MADRGVEPGDPDVDPWAQRELLWERLLSGELTEVFQVAGEGLITLDFGLVPIEIGAYQYDAAGELRSSAELDRIVRELSEQRCWAVPSLRPYHSPGRGHVLEWDRLFIDRAQVALIVLKATPLESFLRAVHTLMRSRSRTDGPVFATGIEYDRAQVKFHRLLREYHQPYTPRYSLRTPYKFVLAKHLLDKHPDTTLVVSSPQEIAQLKRLRIPREPRPGQSVRG